MKCLSLFFLGVALIALASCNNNNKKTDSSTSAKDTVTVKKMAEPALSKETLATIATEVLIALKAKDYQAFAAYIHPTDGVLFSPYGYIDTKAAKKLTKTAFLQLIKDKTTVNWGDYDGSGEPIDLTLQQYMDKFVYNADYLNAEKTAFNEVIGKGNSPSNLSKIFTDHPFVEYYFSGFDKKYQGMDWTSLRLVFKQQQSTYFLVAIVHDQWTI